MASAAAASWVPTAVTTSTSAGEMPMSRLSARSAAALSATSVSRPCWRSSTTSSRRWVRAGTTSPAPVSPAVTAARVSSPGGRVSKSGRATGSEKVNVLPSPGVLSAVMNPPSSCAISRLIDRPSPVPPYLRLVVPSACWNAPKIDSSWCSAMPMPVSATRKATAGPCARSGRGSRSGSTRSMCSSITPTSVNLTALDSRLRSTCRSRESSVSSSAGDPGATVIRKSRLRCDVIGRNVAST